MSPRESEKYLHLYHCCRTKRKRSRLGKLVCGGYTYITSYFTECPRRRYLRCSQYAHLRCKARAVQNCQTLETKIFGIHNHNLDLNEDNVLKFLAELKNCIDLNRTLKDIYDDVAQSYLRCMEYKRLGCHARAVIPYDGSLLDIKLNRPHNHPPDHAAEEKIIFLREIKEVLQKNPAVSSRTVYQTLAELYPAAAHDISFESVRNKMNRWKRQKEAPGQHDDYMIPKVEFT